MSNWAASAIKHHREQADKRRDQWIRLADELASYGDSGLWDDKEGK